MEGWSRRRNDRKISWKTFLLAFPSFSIAKAPKVCFVVRLFPFPAFRGYFKLTLAQFSFPGAILYQKRLKRCGKSSSKIRGKTRRKEKYFGSSSTRSSVASSYSRRFLSWRETLLCRGLHFTTITTQRRHPLRSSFSASEWRHLYVRVCAIWGRGLGWRGRHFYLPIYWLFFFSAEIFFIYSNLVYRNGFCGCKRRGEYGAFCLLN